MNQLHYVDLNSDPIQTVKKKVTILKLLET